MEAGYDALVANFGSGSDKDGTLFKDQWLEPAQQTTAGAVRPIPVGMRLALGNGAEMVVVAANGRVWNNDPISVPNENDGSIALFITYGNFQYLLDGDLGAGEDPCTSRDDMDQKDLQSHVAGVLAEHGFLDEDYGLDVMHVAHHTTTGSAPTPPALLETLVDAYSGPSRPLILRQAGQPSERSEYNQGTGCGKTARQGLGRRRWVTGVPTARCECEMRAFDLMYVLKSVH